MQSPCGNNPEKRINWKEGIVLDFKVLAVGDVVGGPGMDRVRRSLRYLIKKCNADFVVVNGENASVVGITPDQAEDILDAGADVITMGNHTWGKREIAPYMDDCTRILRPANYAPQVPGRGYGLYETKAGSVAVIDLVGRCNMDYGPNNPFLQVEQILKEIDAKIILSDQHQVFGRMTGKVVLDDGRVLEIKNLMCFAEDVHNRY
jgi:calcineurin-like phosphoesterase